MQGDNSPSQRRTGLHSLFGVLVGSLLVAGCGDSPASGPARVAQTDFARDMDGTWAATPYLCGRAVWRISSTAVVSDSGVACRLENLRPSANGWTASARCADRPGGSLEFTPAAGEPRSLVVTGAAFNAPVTLVRCADPGDGQPARDPHAPLEAATAVDLAIASDDPGIVGRRDEANAIVRAAWWEGDALIKIVEPSVAYDRGPRRIYYFRPGEEPPFLVRDREAVFAFVDGKLVTIFSPEGEVLSPLERARFDSEVRDVLRDAMLARDLARTLSQKPSAPPGEAPREKPAAAAASR